MMKFWHSLRERKQNNKGSSIVMVLVIMAMLIILVAIVLSLALMNYRMKTTDRESLRNFYDAETALEEIRIGLTDVVSTAAAEAYNTTMEEFATLSEAERRDRFKTSYINNLKFVLKEDVSSVAGSDTYSCAYIESLIREIPYSDESGIGARLLTVSGENIINETNNGLVLKNIKVEYCGENGFVNEIKTDIVLGFPTINFSQIATMPNLLAYSIVAQDHVQISEAAICNINGNAYLGINDSTVDMGATLSAKSKITAVDDQLLISGAALKGTGNSKIYVSDMELWSSDVVIDSSMANVARSTVYMQDDLILSNSLYSAQGAKTPCSVTVDGAYYGFGNLESAVNASAFTTDADKVEEIESHPANYNSSMIINGVNSTLDISGLSVFKLAGNAYINATEHADALDDMVASANREEPGAVDAQVTEGINTEDVMMGESIAIRTDQIAWLVPADCIAPEADNGGVNPMPITQYAELLDEIADSDAIDSLVALDKRTEKLGGATLGELGVTGWQIEAQQVVGTAKSMVYVFAKFDSTASANDFFRQYYAQAQNLTKLGDYLDLYVAGGIRLPEEVLEASGDTNFYFNGNILASEASNLYVSDTLSGVSASVGAEMEERMLEEGVAYQDNFAALNTKLLKDYSQILDVERGKTVYENLVNDMGGGSTSYSIPGGSHRAFVSSTKQAALIVNNAGYGAFTASDLNIIPLITGVADADGNTHPDAKCYVLIASGDVVVESNFTGLIIAGGTITVKGRAVILTADAKNAAQALMAKNEDGVHAYDYLKYGETYTISGNFEGEQPAIYSEESLNMLDFVSYANWSKQ